MSWISQVKKKKKNPTEVRNTKGHSKIRDTTKMEIYQKDDLLIQTWQSKSDFLSPNPDSITYKLCDFHQIPYFLWFSFFIGKVR